jgi:hypothetical protein
MITEVDRDSITVTVPIVRTRHGSRQMLAAMGGGGRRLTGQPYKAAIRAFARARRWLRLLETGAARDYLDIAARTGIDPANVGRIMRLNFISPRIVNRLVENRDTAGISLARLFKIATPVWSEQEEALRG